MNDNIIFTYKQFTKTLKTVAKQTIPRLLEDFGKIISPCMTKSVIGYTPMNEYQDADSPDTIQSSTSALTDVHDEKRRERWIDTISNIHFTHPQV